MIPLFLLITKWLSLGTSGETTSWITSIYSMVCWKEVDSIYIITTSHNHQRESLHSDETCSSTTVSYYYHMVYQLISFFEHIFFSFFSNFFTYQLGFSLSWPLNLLSSSNFFPNFWLFLILFWMLWMLVHVNKRKHMACPGTHAS